MFNEITISLINSLILYMALLCIRIVDTIYFYAMVPQISIVHLTKFQSGHFLNSLFLTKR